MIRGLMALLLTVFIPCVGMTASFSGGSASFVTKASRHPNIIFLMIDEVGREHYPQLGSPYAATASDETFASGIGLSSTKYILQAASAYPNLNLLLDNGINFTGMWSGAACRPTRQMLQSGNILNTTNAERIASGQDAPMRAIQNTTGTAYAIAHWGKSAMGSSGTPTDCTNGCAASIPAGGGHGSIGWTVNNANTGTGSVAVSDTQLWTVDGELAMWSDENAFIGIEQYIEGLYGSKSPKNSNWFENQTGKPFILTLSPHSVHGGSAGTNCLQNRTPLNGYLYPSDDTFALFTSLPFPLSIPVADISFGPSPNYNAGTTPSWTTVMSSAPDAFESYKGWHDCIDTELKWLDEYVGRLITWLGPHGLENTLIIFTGDNGSPGGMPANRTGAAVPASSAVLPTSAPWLLGASVPPGQAVASGKGSHAETGLNVPFVVAYGKIPNRLRGTSSAARLNFADVAETMIQLVSPRVAPYFTNPNNGAGRNFTPLIYGTAADQDRLFGITIVGSGNVVATGNVAAVMDPDASGNIYRMLKNPGAGNNCDYIQDLSSFAYEANLRGSADAEVRTAICDMQAAIEAAWPDDTSFYQEPVTCLPTYSSICP